ncbi:MAG: hypothetical protein PHF86_08330 [Candidatus Nanoarchaeia archaeon]|nr:hypothetical protein [Candidatus Nanoarchaeia archaeon]
MENIENPMYVNIENSISFRKEILETAIDVTGILKNYEEYKYTKDRKSKKLQELRGLLLDAKKTFREMNKNLPELPEEKVVEPKTEKQIEVKKEIPKEEVKIEEPKVVVSKEEDKLTKELMEIQKKLKTL